MRRSGDVDRWHFDIQDRLVELSLNGAKGVGLFDDGGNFNGSLADRFADEFGLDMVTYEAPTKPSQFALLDHFGPQVRLCNVRLEELLRVEIPQARDHFVAEWTRNESPARLDQRHLQFIVDLAQGARAAGAAKAAADHDDARGGLRECRPRQNRRRH